MSRNYHEYISIAHKKRLMQIPSYYGALSPPSLRLRPSAQRDYLRHQTNSPVCAAQSYPAAAALCGGVFGLSLIT